MTMQQPEPKLSASDLRFLQSVRKLMAERVAPEAIDKVRVGDVVSGENCKTCARRP
jgi:hypothetical protein